MFMTEHVMTEGMADMEERSMQGQGASCFHVTRMNADEISEAAALEREAFPDPWSELSWTKESCCVSAWLPDFGDGAWPLC